MKDIYDEQIEFLTANPDLIYENWVHGSPLFKYVDTNLRTPLAGCLTMIKCNNSLTAHIHPDVDQQLTEEIRNDIRIPDKGKDIQVNHLPVFAEWQRKIDTLKAEYKTKSST